LHELAVQGGSWAVRGGVKIVTGLRTAVTRFDLNGLMPGARAGQLVDAGAGIRLNPGGLVNAMTDASRAAALALAKRGETFDLGMTYSRRSFKWPGHSPGEIITFRSPDGISRMKDADAPPDQEGDVVTDRRRHRRHGAEQQQLSTSARDRRRRRSDQQGLTRDRREEPVDDRRCEQDEIQPGRRYGLHDEFVDDIHS
jgi:hypothetical protein